MKHGPLKTGNARGWLLKGAEGAPAVVCCCIVTAAIVRGSSISASRWNETTNFTILWPDLRGHGESAHEVDLARRA